MNQTDNMISKLQKTTYKVDDVKPINPRQTLTDEELVKLFTSMEGNYYEATVLKKILDGKVKINSKDPKTSVISSTYLSRMCRLTGNRWRQKRALGKNEEALVKIYTDNTKYKPRRRKRSK